MLPGTGVALNYWRLVADYIPHETDFCYRLMDHKGCYYEPADLLI